MRKKESLRQLDAIKTILANTPISNTKSLLELGINPILNIFNQYWTFMKVYVQSQ